MLNRLVSLQSYYTNPGISMLSSLVSWNAGREPCSEGTLVALVWFETQVDGAYVNGNLCPLTFEVAGITLDQYQMISGTMVFSLVSV